MFDSNLIDDMDQLAFLAVCQHLTTLTLDGNPLCSGPVPSDASADMSTDTADDMSGRELCVSKLIRIEQWNVI